MSDISDIRPEDSVSLANLDTTSHTYQSLLSNPWSLPAPQATPSYATTTNGYLNALASRHAGQSSRTHSRRRRSNVRQTEELQDVYKKIKILFTIICVMVVVMVISVLVTHPKIGLFASDGDDERIEAYYVSGQGKNKEFSLCAKCQVLKDDQIIRDTRSSQNREFCCFRRIGQLINLFDSMFERHSNQLKSEDSESSHKTNADARSPTENTSRTMAHCNLITTDNTELSPLHWSCEVKAEIEVVDEQQLQVSVSGFYYIYSHLLLTPQTDHMLMRKETNGAKKKLMYKTMSSQEQTSLLEGIFLLKEGDAIYVVSKESGITKRSTSNFGTFMV